MLYNFQFPDTSDTVNTDLYNWGHCVGGRIQTSVLTVWVSTVSTTTLTLQVTVLVLVKLTLTRKTRQDMWSPVCTWKPAGMACRQRWVARHFSCQQLWMKRNYAVDLSNTLISSACICALLLLLQCPILIDCCPLVVVVMSNTNRLLLTLCRPCTYL